jgi:hypothetical protein
MALGPRIIPAKRKSGGESAAVAMKGKKAKDTRAAEKENRLFKSADAGPAVCTAPVRGSADMIRETPV